MVCQAGVFHPLPIPIELNLAAVADACPVSKLVYDARTPPERIANFKILQQGLIKCKIEKVCLLHCAIMLP
jgi:hypothetical protein